MLNSGMLVILHPGYIICNPWQSPFEQAFVYSVKQFSNSQNPQIGSFRVKHNGGIHQILRKFLF